MRGIIFSEEESKFFDLKMGRAEMDEISVNEIQQQIIEENYDLCRLRVKTGDSLLIQKLEEIGFSYYFSGAITTYKVDFSREQLRPYRDPSIEFELYDGTKYDLFKGLLEEIFDDYPLSFYAIDALNALIPRTKQRQGVSSYFAGVDYDDWNQPAWFVKYKGEYAGILIARSWDNRTHGEGTLSGVIPKYRNTGLFLDIINFIQNYCIETNIRWGHTGARLHEIASHKFFTKKGMYVDNSYLVFYISSLLSKSVQPSITSPIAHHDARSLMTIMLEKANEQVPDSSSLVAVKSNLNLSKTPIGVNEIKITTPVWTSTEQTVVVQLLTNKSQPAAIGYFEYKS